MLGYYIFGKPSGTKKTKPTKLIFNYSGARFV